MFLSSFIIILYHNQFKQRALDALDALDDHCAPPVTVRFFKPIRTAE